MFRFHVPCDLRNPAISFLPNSAKQARYRRKREETKPKEYTKQTLQGVSWLNYPTLPIYRLPDRAPTGGSWYNKQNRPRKHQLPATFGLQKSGAQVDRQTHLLHPNVTPLVTPSKVLFEGPANDQTYLQSKCQVQKMQKLPNTPVLFPLFLEFLFQGTIINIL